MGLYIKIELFCSSKYTIKTVKKIKRKKCFQHILLVKSLFSRLYKELPDKNNVEVDNLIGKKDKKPEKVLHICTQ